MNDLATLNGRPRRLTAAGESHDIYPLSLSDLGDLQAWVESQYPDPYAIAHAQLAAGRWSVEQQRYILRCAMEEASKPRPRLGTPEADALVDTFDGKVETLYLAIRKGEPDFTRDAARAFLERLSEAEAVQAVAVTDVGLACDPKGTATPGTPTGGRDRPGTGGRSTTRR